MGSVSIIIPNYNGGKYISECLNSCIKQGSCVREIIVVDDNSSDNSLDVLKEYQKKWPELIRVYTSPRKGACAARNFGFEHATGDFIQFLDSDDILGEGKIINQLHILLQHDQYQDILVHGKWGRFRDNEEVYFWGPHESISKDLKPVDWLIANHMSGTHCWLIPRSLIEKGGGWDESLKRNQDGEFFSRLMLNASKVLYSEKAEVLYRSGVVSSVSSTKNKDAAVSNLKAIQLIEQYIFSLEQSERARLTVANMYQSFVLEYYVAFPELTAAAQIRVKELGGSTVKLQGGHALQLLSKVVGWKQALNLKRLLK
jgi:glycosyltransferase involved in cell wall biosynthesis